MNEYLENVTVTFIVLFLCSLPIHQSAFAGSSTQLGSTWNLEPQEVDKDRATAHTIELYSSVAGQATSNLYGSQTTADNIYSAAGGTGGSPSHVFYIGHASWEMVWNFFPIFWENQYFISDDNGGKVYDKDIYPHSSSQNVKCAFLWACEQANEIGGGHPSLTVFGMPFAWLHTVMLSNDGYANPDSGDQVFLGFYKGAPMFTRFGGDGYQRFAEGFYYAALIYGQSYSVQWALDYGAFCEWHGYSSFADTDLYQGIYHTEYEPWEHQVLDIQMRVYGNTLIHLSDQSVACKMKPKFDGIFYFPNRITHRYIEISQLFDTGNLTGDQTDGIGNYPDGKVDIRDISFVNSKYGKNDSQNGWDYMADVYPDRKIDIRDVSLVAKHFGMQGTYITDLTGVTVTFEIYTGETQEVTPDINGFTGIPIGATSFTVKRNGSQVGAVVLFWST